jgi:hypothetical protein
MIEVLRAGFSVREGIEAAGMLSISCRALDYLVANKQLFIRRIGTRVLIPLSELRRFSRSDHPERLVG